MYVFNVIKQKNVHFLACIFLIAVALIALVAIAGVAFAVRAVMIDVITMMIMSFLCHCAPCRCGRCSRNRWTVVVVPAGARDDVWWCRGGCWKVHRRAIYKIVAVAAAVVVVCRRVILGLLLVLFRGKIIVQDCER